MISTANWQGLGLNEVLDLYRSLRAQMSERAEVNQGLEVHLWSECADMLAVAAITEAFSQRGSVVTVDRMKATATLPALESGVLRAMDLTAMQPDGRSAAAAFLAMACPGYSLDRLLSMAGQKPALLPMILDQMTHLQSIVNAVFDKMQLIECELGELAEA